MKSWLKKEEKTVFSNKLDKLISIFSNEKETDFM